MRAPAQSLARFEVGKPTERTLRHLSNGPPALPGRLKHSVIGPYFRWASVDGMIDPFALEVLANPDLLPVETPFVAAHEWAHLGGYADESEASFVGWLTCLRAGEAAQYSAWLFLYWEISSVVPARRSRRARGRTRTRAAGRHRGRGRPDPPGPAATDPRDQLDGLRPVSKANRVEEGDSQLRRGDHAAGTGTIRGQLGAGAARPRQALRTRAGPDQPLSRSGSTRPAAARRRRSPIASPSPALTGCARAKISSTPAASSSRRRRRAARPWSPRRPPGPATDGPLRPGQRIVVGEQHADTPSGGPGRTRVVREPRQHRARRSFVEGERRPRRIVAGRAGRASAAAAVAVVAAAQRTAGSTVRSMSSVTAPGRRTMGARPPDRAPWIRRPPASAPPSRTRSIRPSRSSSTCAARRRARAREQVRARRRDRHAAACSSACATGCAGTRMADGVEARP